MHGYVEIFYFFFHMEWKNLMENICRRGKKQKMKKNKKRETNN